MWKVIDPTVFHRRTKGEVKADRASNEGELGRERGGRPMVC